MSEIAKRTDLTEEEGAPGLRGDPTIEVDGSIYVPGMGLRFRLRASSVPRETLGRPLACSWSLPPASSWRPTGWGSAEVMKSIGAPGWAQLAGMLIPTVVGLQQYVEAAAGDRYDVLLDRRRLNGVGDWRTIPRSGPIGLRLSRDCWCGGYALAEPGRGARRMAGRIQRGGMDRLLAVVAGERPMRRPRHAPVGSRMSRSCGESMT